MIDKSKIDYSLYLVTDRELSFGRSNLDIVMAAANGGVTLVQLREKKATTAQFYEEGLRISDFLKSRNIPLIINDRIDLALALDVDGVHIGSDDMPLDIARKILGPDKIIGVSVFTVQDAINAESGGADYLGLSPIFITATKPELTAQIGIEGIPAISKAVNIPIVGIGGLNQTNAYAAISAGLDGIAVVSGICSQKSPTMAAKAIKAEIMRARGLFLNGVAHGELK